MLQRPTLLLFSLTIILASAAVFAVHGLSTSSPTTSSTYKAAVGTNTSIPTKDHYSLLERRIMFLAAGLGLLSVPALPTLAVMIKVPAAAATPPSSRNGLDVGGGFDLLGTPRLAEKDVIYPISMEGLWVCNRIVTQIEGDTFQAESAWRALSGGSSLKINNEPESYSTRFVRSNLVGDGVVVNDRGYELSSRGGANRSNNNVSWNVDQPDSLEYDNKVKIVVVKRSIEPPTDQGFGFNELYRIDDGLITRAVQVKRRYRRAYDDAIGGKNNRRVVEGLEIMKTFRVLDGVAGIEMPTSTTKSQLRLTRL